MMERHAMLVSADFSIAYTASILTDHSNYHSFK